MMLPRKKLLVIAAVGVISLAAFFYHKSSNLEKDLEVVTEEVKRTDVVIDKVIADSVVHNKAAESHEQRVKQIREEAAKAEHELNEVFNDSISGPVDSERLTSVLLKYQDSLRASASATATGQSGK